MSPPINTDPLPIDAERIDRLRQHLEDSQRDLSREYARANRAERREKFWFVMAVLCLAAGFAACGLEIYWRMR